MRVRMIPQAIRNEIPANARQRREYGADPIAVAVKFSIGRRGRPPAGCEARVFALDEAGKQELADFLLEGRWRDTPHVVVQLVGEIHDGRVEMVYEKTMIVSQRTEEVVFSVQPTAL